MVFGSEEKNVAEENRFGLTDRFMKVTGKEIQQMEKED